MAVLCSLVPLRAKIQLAMDEVRLANIAITSMLYIRVTQHPDFVLHVRGGEIHIFEPNNPGSHCVIVRISHQI